VTSKHGVPLLINDRADVALEVGCEGVHVGQDDMSKWHLQWRRFPALVHWKVSRVLRFKTLPNAGCG
jgi:hypothetical protein